jgi:hypothetical protein
VFSSRVAAIKIKLPKILEACTSNAQGIKQLNAHVEFFMAKFLAHANARMLSLIEIFLHVIVVYN